MTSPAPTRLSIGDVLDVRIEKVAHGGHFIARHGAEVIFVRHGIPGELVRVFITASESSFHRGDVVETLEASPDRVVAPCSFSHRLGCGGCDFQHISGERQRKLKAEVIKEQFLRLAKMQVELDVEEVSELTRWRTRATARSDSQGRFGFYAARSHNVVPIDDCLITVKSMKLSQLAARTWKSDLRIEIAASSKDEQNIALAPARGPGPARLTQGPALLHEEVAGKVLQISQSSFWQSNVSAPRVLTSAVLELARFKSGEHVLDLYGGVGLFTAAIVDEIGATGSIELIEGSKSATGDATKNFLQYPNIKITTGNVEKHLSKITRADVVVLDPPREGAGKIVLGEIARIKPRAVVYVACDPASLARDTDYFSKLGYSLSVLRAFDLFPMTHHIECVALYLPN